MSYERGSEWKKWDLHVHTPYSVCQKFGANNEGTWEKYIDDLEDLSDDFAVIGVNDYLFIDGYKKLKNEQDKNSRLQKIKLLPVVEFRIEKFAGIEFDQLKRINLHVIFSDDVPIDTIESQFLNTLTQSYYLERGNEWARAITMESVAELGSEIKKSIPKEKLSEYGSDLTEGFNNLNINEDQIFKSLEKSCFKDKYLVAIGKTEWDSLKWTDSSIATKKSIINQADIVFTAAESTVKFENAKNKLTENKVNDLLLDCSDAHSFSDSTDKDRIGNCFTWIKADPTFEGLKQIIYEPEERIYIGEKPPILSKVENNKTNYIKSLEINQTNASHSGDIWFKNISIPFNNELTAIIGNKGSGKSGIADILGLVGDTHTDKQHFSFLHKDKFLKGKLADKFKAKIVWESDGESGDVPLSAALKTEKPESVRFIPQNYFEELTNELEISKFQHVLENIIFEYIPDNEKLNKSSFEELESYKAENVNTAIQDQKNKIQNINKEIIDLEKKKHPDYLKSIEGLISKKKIEISEQNKLLKDLPVISSPSTDDKDSKQQGKITKHNAELDILKNNLKEKEKERTALTSKIEELTQFKRKIELQEQSVKEFLQSHTKEAAKEYNLDINKILKIKVDYSLIEEKIQNSEKELKHINISFESFESIRARSAESNNDSIIYKINLLTNQLKTETDKLTGEEKEYQKNEQRKKSINEKIQELTGTPDNPSLESLKFYEKEKEFITEDLPPLLEEMRNERIEQSLEIFKKKNEIIELYNSFKQSVDDKIVQNKDLLEDYDIKIDSSFNLNPSFYSDFLGYINQRKSGCFLGAEKGENKIKSIVEENGFSDENKIKSLLENIINSLEDDSAEISDQINGDKLNSFYDYVFSLDYLNPKYELKLGGKVLGQLSPGERGALLLIFYLMIDKEEIPLVIDQPEDNLDNESVYNMLSKFIKQAKKKRQIIMVTHNPNLAVGADAEQIIHVSIDKTNKNKFSFVSGSIENPKINKKIVQILEGTKPAFDKRKLKYQGQ